MQFNKFYNENFYYFTDYINEQICRNVLKFKKISIVYNKKTLDNIKCFLDIKNFCKYNNIKLYIINNIRIAYKFNLDGVVLSHDNKRVPFLNNTVFKKNFKIIGKLHNQQEYYFKKKQKCESLIFSPIFKNKKYTDNQILGILKFNLISKNWREKVFALGGINYANFKRIKSSKAKGCGFNNFINNLEIKKPVLFLKGRA